MKKPDTKLLLIFAILFCATISFAQNQDSVKVDSLTTFLVSDRLAGKQAPYIEIYKLNARRQFKLVKGQPVRIYMSRKKNGGVKSKAAVVSNIDGHEVSFEPISKQFDFVTYTDSTMTYIEIQTAGSVLRGLVINAFLVSMTAITVGVVVVVTLVTVFSGRGAARGSGNGLGSLISLLPWDNFHKHIHFRNHRGSQIWGARIVGN